MEGYLLSIAKPVHDRNYGTVVATGVVADVDNQAFQTIEIMADPVQRCGQFLLFDSLQFEDPNVTNIGRATIM